MGKINYSFIIPHKNSQSLLLRCIQSIPNRNDVQIIVVDDNSTDIEESWNEFLNKVPHVLFLKGTDCHSAGAVRNIGLSYAQGKWILFADCDDYYTENFLNILDQYIDTNNDVVYFNSATEGINTISGIQKIISSYNINPQKWLDYIRYKIRNPWMKMVKHELLVKYDIKFEDIVLGNDIWYSIQVGYFAKYIFVLDANIYVYSYNPYGISNNRTVAKDVAEIEGYIKMNEFFKFIGHPEWKISFLGYIKWNLFHRSHPILQVMAYVKNIFHFYKVRNYYVNQLKIKSI